MLRLLLNKVPDARFAHYAVTLREMVGFGMTGFLLGVAACAVVAKFL